MRAHDIATIFALLGMALPALAVDTEASQASVATPTTVDASVDTFGKLLAKQVRLIESELDAKIRSNENQSQIKNQAPAVPAGVSPLPEARQEVSTQDPIVEAIWGIEGKEVAEISFKGRRVAVSMREPYISRIDGWKLESINPFEITLIQSDGIKISKRKSISLDWENTSPKLPNVINR